MASSPANRNDRVVRLTAERLQRLERRMEKVETAIKGTNARLEETNTRLEATNTRLDQAVDVLTRLVRVVAAQNDRVNRNFGQLGSRFDRLTRSILAGRTTDTRRLTALARHLETMERRLS